MCVIICGTVKSCKSFNQDFNVYTYRRLCVCVCVCVRECLCVCVEECFVCMSRLCMSVPCIQSECQIELSLPRKLDLLLREVCV